MGAQLLSVNNVGKHRGDMSISFAVGNANSSPVNDFPPDALQATPPFAFIPLVAGELMNQYTLNPANVQPTGNFGAIKGIQISITRPRAWYVSNTSYFMPGKIWVHVPSTGQVMCFCVKNLEVLTAAPTIGMPPETENSIVPTHAAANSPVNVWMEPDNGSSPSLPGIQTQAIVTLFNFPIGDEPGAL